MLPNVPHFSLYTWCLFGDKYLWTLPQTWSNIARRQLTEWNHIWEFVVVVNTQGESYKTTNNLLLGVFCCYFYFSFLLGFAFPNKPMLQTIGAVYFTNVRTQRNYRPAWGHTANSIKALFPMDTLLPISAISNKHLSKSCCSIHACLCDYLARKVWVLKSSWLAWNLVLPAKFLVMWPTYELTYLRLCFLTGLWWEQR